MVLDSSKDVRKLIPALVILFLSVVLSLAFRNGWPMLLAVTAIFVYKPSWWLVIIMGFAYTVFLKSGWPLVASVVFALVGKPKRWWPIPAGIAFALVEVFSFYLSERPIGITRGFTVMAAITEYLIYPAHIDNVEYWSIYEPKIDWTMAMILGVTIGSFLSARYSGEFKWMGVPDMWRQSKGPSVFKRWVWVFLAGIVMGFAARIAGGCVSGLLISGAIQLVPSGFIFMISLWVGGVLTSFLFYRGGIVAVKKE
ncbi:YeeE/YedE thiosulfate transporter family protein [Candidatus Magnetomonas plexicatena]|uniref:YeeE/YedE thiosulfate transporter family protein n=1 Tax=Candidatus Magnetomonas plexicatena TaxID=2552947 RepID=UPI001C77A3B8|nr:YeeE/YedE family protein [Nitrospirales bacterium LBB_01]